ncbi:MAG TPA: AAA family ATPase [Chloroflexota bacterium]
MAGMPQAVTRLVIENYKSIARCDVELGPLTFLVGQNGAGKSNFLDALRFVSDALRNSLDSAIRDRGSFNDLRFKGADLDAPVLLRLEVALPNEEKGEYSFSLIQDPDMGYKVAEERCTTYYPATDQAPTGFHLRDGFHVNHPNWPEGVPAAQPKQLHLPFSVDLRGRPPIYNVLAGMAFYDPIPAHMRSPERHDQGDRLQPDGSNCASVLLRLATQRPQALQRIKDYMKAILPGLQRIQGTALGGYDVLEFTQRVSDRELSFPPISVSDGALHALAVLTSLFQADDRSPQAPSLVTIEEPGGMLHPGATGVLLDALRDASEHVQVLVTTHSPDILDDKDVDSDSVLAVVSRDGESTLGPLDGSDRSLVRDHLYTVGDLMRQGALEPGTPSDRDAGVASTAGVR